MCVNGGCGRAAAVRLVRPPGIRHALGKILSTPMPGTGFEALENEKNICRRRAHDFRHFPRVRRPPQLGLEPMVCPPDQKPCRLAFWCHDAPPWNKKWWFQSIGLPPTSCCYLTAPASSSKRSGRRSWRVKARPVRVSISFARRGLICREPFSKRRIASAVTPHSAARSARDRFRLDR